MRAKVRKHACDTCHARKIHCDGAEPNCDWCSHQGLKCTFDRPGKRAARRSKNHSRDVSRKSSTSNSWPLPSTPSSGGNIPTLIPISAALDSPQNVEYSTSAFCFQERLSDQVLSPAKSPGWSWADSPFSTTEGRNWIRRWTGESTLLDSLSLSQTPLDSPWQTNCQIGNPTAESVELTVTNLPPKNIVDQYLQMFRSTPFRFVFPIVDAVLFQATIDSAYEPGNDSIGSSACVFAFLSIMSHTQWTPKSTTVIDGAACSKQAELRLGLISSQVDISRLQVYIIQCMYALFSGNLQLATMRHAIACRLLFQLDGHLCTPLSQQDNRATDGASRERRVKVQLRKLFWLCYTFDKILALRTGQPPCIDDEHCDLTLPSGYSEMLYSDGNFDAAPSTTLCFFPSDLRLSIIKSRTCKLLYSSRVQRLSDAEVLRIVRMLDDELESWRTSIPHQYRPTLSYKDDDHGFDPAMDSTQRMHIVIIHLEYHHLMAKIHRITSRSLAWNDADGANLVNQGRGISSSQALSVEASRANLEYLGVAAHALMGPIFWVIVFYPIDAILTIIGNILLDPQDVNAEQDMKLLESTSNVIKQVRDQECTPMNELDIARMDSLVSEVIRLGRHTIDASMRTRDDNELFFM